MERFDYTWFSSLLSSPIPIPKYQQSPGTPGYYHMLIRNNTHAAVTNVIIKQNSLNLTFRMLRHTSTELTIENRGDN